MPARLTPASTSALIRCNRAKSSPLRDVAGMLRSFSYATAGSRLLRGHEPPDGWEESARERFLAGYQESVDRSLLPPGQQSTEQDGGRTETLEEAVGKVEVAPADPDVTAVALHQRTSAETADLVGDNRTQIAAQRAERCHCRQRETAGVHQVAGERHDDFRGQRNAG